MKRTDWLQLFTIAIFIIFSFVAGYNTARYIYQPKSTVSSNH